MCVCCSIIEWDKTGNLIGYRVRVFVYCDAINHVGSVLHASRVFFQTVSILALNSYLNEILTLKSYLERVVLKICRVLHCCFKFQKLCSTASPLKHHTQRHIL